MGHADADDACIVSRSPQGLAKMMEVIVEVCRAFALTVSAKKTETMCMPPPRTPRTVVQIEAAGQTYKQVQFFTSRGGAVTEVPDMSVEIARRTRACWMRIRWYLRELYDQPKVSLSLKTRMVKAEVIEALLYGRSTWTLRQEHYLKLRTVHHRVLLRIIGAQRKRPDHRMTSYNRALEITGCESIETTLRTRRLLWAGTLLRMSGGRLPKRIVFGNLESAVRRGRGGKEKEWTDCVQSDIRAFGIAGDWKATALKAEVRVETVTEGRRRFMAAWRKEEVDVARHRLKKREELSQTGVTSRRYPCTDARPTKTCVEPVDASRDFIYFLRTSSVGGGGGYAARLFILFFLPCSANHERDWPPCKVAFFRLATKKYWYIRTYWYILV